MGAAASTSRGGSPAADATARRTRERCVAVYAWGSLGGDDVEGEDGEGGETADVDAETKTSS